MSLLIHQLNTDNDILYLIKDSVDKIRYETKKNKQRYNTIIYDLKIVFNCYNQYNYYNCYNKYITLFNFIDYIRMLLLNNTYNYSFVGNRIGSHSIQVSRMNDLFNGYKYHVKYHKVKYPNINDSKRNYYIGCSYPKIHLSKN